MFVYSTVPYRSDLLGWRQAERICVLSDPLPPIRVQARPSGLEAGGEDLCTLRPQVEKICVLSDPLFVFRPDLVDWRQVERRQVRERIDLAFHVMDREYGVTRLLDPEGKPMK
jgi:hypothetical protein